MQSETFQSCTLNDNFLHAIGLHIGKLNSEELLLLPTALSSDDISFESRRIDSDPIILVAFARMIP